ncbi:hypothetical protein OKW38_003878 [Paraburkholderia sp. MM5496-R1]|uniref:hypothetical protein n=2 Tax=unclassified Paraburkholderia TaxID=2615204 RepID=UPI003D2514C6
MAQKMAQQFARVSSLFRTPLVFTNAAGGSVTNNRDAGTRDVQVSVPRQITIIDNGQTLFQIQSVQADGSAYLAAAGSSNQGKGTLGTYTDVSVIVAGSVLSVPISSTPEGRRRVQRDARQCERQQATRLRVRRRSITRSRRARRGSPTRTRTWSRSWLR